MVQLSIIAAIADNFVIGNKNDIPWYIPEDFKHFKQTTLGKPVIMGYNTWLSLPIKPLPKRENIVISKEPIKIEGVKVFTDIPSAIEYAKSLDTNEVFIIGGASIYAQTIELADNLYLSHVKGNFEGDTYFPKFEIDNYNVVEEKEFKKFIFKKYSKK